MRRVLLDLRESDTLRGFHVAAAAMLMAPSLGTVACQAIGGAEGDERLALDLLAHDTQVNFEPWTEGDAMDLLIVTAEQWPDDPLSARAIASSRTVLFGDASFRLRRGSDAPAVPPGVVTVDGHDTAALARRALELLGQGS